MSMKFFRIRHLDLHLKHPCPSKRRINNSKDKGNSSSGQHFCPSCVLPLVVAFIFVFTVAQLILIHRTIVSYKTRHQAFEDCYGSNSNANDSKILVDLAFSRKFHPAWPNRSLEWSSEQKYPYRLPGPRHPPINHIWKTICPQNPSTLKGNISIDLNREIFLADLTEENPEVVQGGKWAPVDCRPRFNVAILIPYRYRWNHLKSVLSVLHPMIRRQQLGYQIFVAEQYGNYTFNKGVLMNAAFLLAMNSSGNAFDCVIFHDVDLLPEDDRNIYGCLGSPSHLSVRVDVYGYKLPYTSLVGGVFAIGIDQFIQVNGYSNLYWGWGAEDDDMYHRLLANHLKINRPVTATARYKMLHHSRRLPNQFVNPLIRTARVRFPQDGLTTCKFRLVVGSAQPLYTHFLIDIGQPSYFVQNQLDSMAKEFQQQNQIHRNPSGTLKKPNGQLLTKLLLGIDKKLSTGKTNLKIKNEIIAPATTTSSFLDLPRDGDPLSSNPPLGSFKEGAIYENDNEDLY